MLSAHTFQHSHAGKSFKNCPIPAQKQPVLNRLKCTHTSIMSTYLTHTNNRERTYIMTPRFRCQSQYLELVLRTCTPGIPEMKIETPTVSYSCVSLTQARLVNPCHSENNARSRHPGNSDTMLLWKGCTNTAPWKQ